MHRFFVKPAGDGIGGDASAPLAGGAAGAAWVVGTEVALSSSDAAHAARVLRLRPGQAVVVSDGRGFDYRATLTAVGPTSVRARLDAVTPSPGEPELFVTLVQGVAKGSKMDFIVQKAVELGVGRIIPATTARTVVRLEGGKARARVERWRRIAYEAAKQAGRGRVPRVEPVHRWDDVWARDDLGLAFVPWEDAGGGGLLTVAREAGVGGRRSGSAVAAAAVAVGPEGGLSPEELERARGRGARPVTLGPRILRTETAAVVAVALLLGAAGELG